VAEWARDAGWRVAGLLSPARLERGEKIGIEALDLHSGARRLLATRGGEGGVRWGEWSFDPSTIAWGNRVLRSLAGCDLLVIDEIGPLELEKGEGWSAALPLLQEGRYRLALAVVRPEYALGQFLRWPGSCLITIPGPRETGWLAEHFSDVFLRLLGSGSERHR
jgi:nucleoside-triphosphatase THEP1